MDNELYIFVANNKLSSINLYLNIISHAITYLSVTNLYFVKITNSESIQDTDVSLYVNKNMNDEIIRRKALNPDLYEKIYQVFTNNKKVLSWDILLIKQYIKKMKTFPMPLFDLSSLPKRVSLDLFIKLVSSGMENIFIFDMKNISKVNSLYHELQKSDFEVVKLLDEEVFKYTFEKYTQKLNRDKLIVVLISIIISIVLIRLFPPTDVSTANYIILFLTFLSGLIPLLELSGFIDLSSLLKKYRK